MSTQNIWNERQELEALIESIGPSRRLANAILAAGYRKPRAITAVAELDALPGGVIIFTEHGGVWKSFKRYDGLNWWEEPGAQKVTASDEITLPATVLYEPQP